MNKFREICSTENDKREGVWTGPCHFDHVASSMALADRADLLTTFHSQALRGCVNYPSAYNFGTRTSHLTSSHSRYPSHQVTAMAPTDVFSSGNCSFCRVLVSDSIECNRVLPEKI